MKSRRGQVQLVGVDEGQDPGTGLGVVDDRPPGQAEGGDPARAAIDHRRHAGVHADRVGLDAEVAESGHDVDVRIDETGHDEQASAVDHLAVVGHLAARGRGPPRPERADQPVRDDDIGGRVGL